MTDVDALQSLEPIEQASIDELRALQLERLKSTLKHAYENSPHYRETFTAAGVSPDDLQTLEDLKKFPFTTKADLRSRYPFGMLALPMDDIVLREKVPDTPAMATAPALIGFISSMMGIGGGSLSVPTLSLFGEPIHRAVGTAALFGLLIAVPGTAGFMVTGYGHPMLPPGSIGFVNLIGLALIAPTTVLAAPLGGFQTPVLYAVGDEPRRRVAAFGVVVYPLGDAEVVAEVPVRVADRRNGRVGEGPQLRDHLVGLGDSVFVQDRHRQVDE